MLLHELHHVDGKVGKVQKLETQLRELEGAIPKTRATIGEIEAKIRVTQSQFRTDARTDLTSAQSELDRLSEEEKAEKDRVDRTDIRAPVDGVVNRLVFNTLGGVVRPGDTVMEVTPLDGKVLIEAKVLPTDRGDLREGLVARARITAYDFGVHGTLPGRLVEVSADTVGDDLGSAMPGGYYRVKVEIDTAGYVARKLPVGQGLGMNTDELAIVPVLLAQAMFNSNTCDIPCSSGWLCWSLFPTSSGFLRSAIAQKSMRPPAGGEIALAHGR